MTPGDCAHFRELAPEIALGLLTGHERAEALAHVDQCGACRQHTAALDALHDRLRALIPSAEPSAGFEQRVLARIGAPPPRPAPRRLLRVAVGAALVAAAFAGGWVARPLPVAAATPLVAGGRHVGDVVVSRDKPDFLSVYLDVSRPGRLRCELLRADGSVAATEAYDAAGGTGWWGIQRPDGDVTTIRVSDATGDVVGAGPLPAR